MTSERVHVPEQGLGSVMANGLQFAFLEWGVAGDPLALLLHGFPDTAHTWDAFGPALARSGFHVVAPFSRGYAPTSIPTGDADAATLGEDVIALIAALGAQRAVVVGHDWGADAAYAAAALAPARVSRIVTVAIPHRGALTPPRLLWKLRHVFALPAPGAARRKPFGNESRRTSQPRAFAAAIAASSEKLGVPATAPITTSMRCCLPSSMSLIACDGSTSLPSTLMLFTPRETPSGFFTSTA